MIHYGKRHARPEEAGARRILTRREDSVVYARSGRALRPVAVVDLKAVFDKDIAGALNCGRAAKAARRVVSCALLVDR